MKALSTYIIISLGSDPHSGISFSAGPKGGLMFPEHWNYNDAEEKPI